MDTKNFIKNELKKRLVESADKTINAGILIKCVRTNNVLLLHRNDTKRLWALVSGGVDKGENPLSAVKREIYEELMIDPNQIEITPVRVEQFPGINREFHYFQGLTNSEFKPILDHENLNWGWFPKTHLPSPLYEGLAQKIAEI